MEFKATMIHDRYDSGDWLWHLETLGGMEIANGTAKDKEAARQAARKAATQKKTDKNETYFAEIISV